MEFIQLNTINQEIKEAIEKLEDKVRQHDETHHYGYYDNRFNFNKEIPWLYLAMDGQKIVGFGNLQCEAKDEIEIILFVDPDYRRQKIATKINQMMKNTMQVYGLSNPVYNTEEKFWQKHPQWAQKYLQDLSNQPQWIMEYDRKKPYNVKKNETLYHVGKAQHDAIAQILAEAFDCDFQEELNFVKQTSLASNLQQYCIRDEQLRIVATASVDYADQVNYIFAVAVAKQEQGKKYGQKIMSLVCQEVMARSNCLIQLQVEVNNETAIAMYEKAGFKKCSKVITIIEK